MTLFFRGINCTQEAEQSDPSDHIRVAARPPWGAVSRPVVRQVVQPQHLKPLLFGARRLYVPAWQASAAHDGNDDDNFEIISSS